MDVCTKTEARAAGARHYFTGKPCARGHIALRFLCGGCTACCAAKSKAWYSDKPRAAAKTRRWRTENSERDRANAEAWRAANPEKVEAALQRYADKNPGARAKSCRDWYWRNIDEQRARAIRYRNENIDEMRIYSLAYNKANPGKIAAHKRNRRARELAGGTHTEHDIGEIMKMQNGRCAYCRIRLRRKYHVDHILALSKGGPNGRSNLQILCAPCNQSKSAKDPIVFAQSLGMLL